MEPGFVGGIILSHREEIRMMEDLMDILWPTHQFLVNGIAVGDRDQVLMGLKEGQMIAYYPFPHED